MGHLVKASLFARKKIQERAVHVALHLGRKSADFLLPPVCLNCHTPLTLSHRLCSQCWKDVSFITRPFCTITGAPLPFDIGEDAISAQAATNPPHYDQARAVALYKGVMRNLIYKLKYQDHHATVNLLSLWLQQKGQSIIDDADLILPVPLHPSRLWQRRYNQSALLAKRLAENTGKTLALGLLIRDKKTRSQIGLTASERQANLKGAFTITALSANKLKRKHILLIDDVITTGATINAAAQTLKRAGAERVTVLTLAMAVTDDNRSDEAKTKLSP